MALFFSDYERRHDQHNHCVPVLDSFEDPRDYHLAYIVMPFLRSIDSPPLEVISDVIDIVDQLLEVDFSTVDPITKTTDRLTQGLAYMHAHGVAHR